MISILLWLVILLVVFAIVWWIVGQIPIPPQFRWIVNVVLGLLFLLVILSLITGVGGIGFPHLVR